MTAPVKPSKLYGAGEYYGINNVTTATPTSFDTLQDFTLSIKRQTKELFGSDQFAADVCAGQASITGKVTMGSLNGRIFADLICGVSSTQNMDNVAKREQGKVSTSHHITVKNNGSGVFIRNLGVVDPATNLPLVCVATITKKTHYTFNATGQYTFHASRDGDKLAISYEWSGNPTALGGKLNLTNQPQGKIGDFTSVMSLDWAKEQNVLTLNSCIASDSEIGTKNGDYAKPTFAFMAGADAYNNIGSLSFAQQR